MLGAIGMEVFVGCACCEFFVIGEKVRKRSVVTCDELMAQEEWIVWLVCDGFFNLEIGAWLFFSLWIVEWHLKKVFIKFGISLWMGFHDVLLSFDLEVMFV